MHDSQWCTYLHISYYKIFHEAGADSSWLVAADRGGGGRREERGGRKEKEEGTKEERFEA